MARIIFLSPFAKNEITGGIKTAYRQVELLVELGFDAWIYQPEGAPSWFDTRARVLTEPRLAPAPGDILVFPETLNGVLAEMVQARFAAKKVLFCQAHYYTLFNPIPPGRYRELGFAKVGCQSADCEGVPGARATPRQCRDHPLLHRCGALLPTRQDHADRANPAQTAA